MTSFAHLKAILNCQKHLQSLHNDKIQLLAAVRSG
jgi:hypothetical protein